MTITLRIILLIAGVLCAIWILYRIRKSKVKVEDSVFWICLAFVLFLLGTFSRISFWLSGLLGIQTPANCVFLLIIAMLIEKIFTLSIKMSQIEDKIEVLTAEMVLRNKDIEKQMEKTDER